MNIDLELLRKSYDIFLGMKPIYLKMYQYYKGSTDIDSNYKMQTERSNLKTKCNYIKKFIKEEVSYSVGNDITYISKSGDEKIVNEIDLNFEELSEKHDNELLKNALIFSKAYEIYTLEDNNIFKSKVVSPLKGFEVKDNIDKVIAFVRVYEVGTGAEIKTYLDVFTSTSIERFTDEFELIETIPHYFGIIPYGKCKLSEEGESDTIYNDIKGLQDAYETNLSDLVNEISDFRNAYLGIYGSEIDEETASRMKANGIMNFPEGARAEWLIKNLNDTFIQNTLNTLEDKMYQLSQHINHNESMQSNLSGIALRSRLISLEEKCKLNQRALTDCIKQRLKALFIIINKIKTVNYDWRDIKIKFTPNIPQDDVGMADIISKLNGILSKETALAQLSFIENPSNEVEKVKKEQKQAFPSLDNLGGGNIE